jgi:hypothetical protein
MKVDDPWTLRSYVSIIYLCILNSDTCEWGVGNDLQNLPCVSPTCICNHHTCTHTPPPPHTLSSHPPSLHTVVMVPLRASRVRSLVPLTPWPRPSVSMTTSTRSCTLLNTIQIGFKKKLPITKTSKNKCIILSLPLPLRIIYSSPFIYHLIIFTTYTYVWTIDSA